MDLYVATGNRRGVARAVHMLGQVYHGLGHPEEAERNYQHALKVLRGSAEAPAAACVPILVSLGGPYEMWGRFEDAAAVLTEATEAQPADAAPADRAALLNNLARLDFRMHRDEQSERKLTEALALLRDLPGMDDATGKYLANLAEL